MKYWYYNKLSIQQPLTYPARIFVWFLVDVLGFIAFPFIWLAVYGSRQSINGFDRADIVTYYIIMAFINIIFTSHIARRVRHDIISGDLNNILVKPISYYATRFLYELGYRIITIFIGVFLALFIYIFLNDYIAYPASLLMFGLFLLSCIFSLFISHLMQTIIGFCAFWLGDINAPQSLRQIAEKIFSGQIAPLIFFPIALQNVAEWLPFKYMFYFPYQIYSGKIAMGGVVNGFVIILFWIFVLTMINVLMWKKGVKSYSGAGI